MSGLDFLARQFGTDKSTRHNGYAPIYDRYLSPWREGVVRLLEIGVGNGASLRMWETYFPRAEIIGLDTDLSRVTPLPIRSQMVTGNQGDVKLLQTLGTFDIIVDDGSHIWKDQIASFRELFPRMATSGLYFVEDVQTSYQAKYSSTGPTGIEYFRGLVDDLNLHGRLAYSLLANCDPARIGKLTGFEGKISFIHFWPGLVVAGREDAPW